MKVKYFLKSFLCYLFSSLLILSSILARPAFADVKLPTGREDEFGENNIVFYNPNGQRNPCTHQGSGGTLTGDGIIEKIWNYITNLNIDGLSNNPAAISGILANMKQESGFNPLIEASNGCRGIIQWCFFNGYNPDFKEITKDYDQYFSKDNNNLKNVDPKIVDEILNLELDIIFKLMPKNAANAADFIKKLKEPAETTGITGARAYADLFLVIVERGINGNDEIEDPNVKAISEKMNGRPTKYQEAAKRRAYAEEIYKTYGSKAGGNNIIDTTNGLPDSNNDSVSNSGTGVTWGTDGFITGGLPGYQKEEPPICDKDENGNCKDWINPKTGKCFKDNNNNCLKKPWSDDDENLPYTTDNKKPNKILLHSTKGSTSGIAAYPSGNHFAPHFTLDAANKKIHQHYSINVASTAVKTVDTEGIIQIELVGFSQPPKNASDKFILQKWGDDEWDYVALVLAAISEQTGIPLNTSVDWNLDLTNPNKIRIKTVGEFKKIVGIVGHMHATDNNHTDPGNIWAQLSAAISRNPSAAKFQNGQYTDNNCFEDNNSGTSIGQLVDGGFKTVEEARKGVMNEYRSINPRSRTPGNKAGNDYLESYGIPPVASGGCFSDLENCVSFSKWFINRFIKKEKDRILTRIGNGGDVVNTLVKNYGFKYEGTTPKVYAIFSIKKGSAVGGVTYGHTGVVLGIDKARGKIIIGEAGCGQTINYTDAKEKDLSKFTNSAYTFAYADVNF